ncbi:hypothetical protein GALMADRAFT_1344134 [Galerina marginata CBS 339.88]|uniref:Uncharacterized protein n=1 Tax=Galerina marginata (strain CBS 339.88) TaxID=685588 RepID=A0A067SNK5_GALM3|nr:hypothetical protein GALMADRAFT_1344134 [Galerina marginata CBS 339.88]
MSENSLHTVQWRYRFVSTLRSPIFRIAFPEMSFLLPRVLVSLVSHASAEFIRLTALDVGTPKNKGQHVRKWILNHRLWRCRNASSLTSLALRNVSPGMVFLLPQGTPQNKDQNLQKWILNHSLQRYRNVSSFTSLAPRNVSPGMTFLLPQVLVSLVSYASAEFIRLTALDVGTPKNKGQHVRKWILNHRLWRCRNVSSLTSLALRNVSPGMIFLLPQGSSYAKTEFFSVLVSLVSHTSNERIRWSAWDVETPKNRVKNLTSPTLRIASSEMTLLPQAFFNVSGAVVSRPCFLKKASKTFSKKSPSSSPKPSERRRTDVKMFEKRTLRPSKRQRMNVKISEKRSLINVLGAVEYSRVVVAIPIDPAIR